MSIVVILSLNSFLDDSIVWFQLIECDIICTLWHDLLVTITLVNLNHYFLLLFRVLMIVNDQKRSVVHLNWVK